MEIIFNVDAEYDLPNQFEGNPYISFSDGEDGTGDVSEIDIGKIVVSLLLCIFGLLGNLIAIFVIVVLKEYRKSVTHWYVLQLAIVDSLFLLTLPFKISEDLQNQFIYPEWMCKLKETILFLNYYSSILLLTIMSFDRYIAVCHTLSIRLQRLRKPGIAFLITLCIWLISLVCSIPIILYSFKNGFHPNCYCSYVFPQEDQRSAECEKANYGDQETIETCRNFLNFSVGEVEEIYCKNKVFDYDFFFGKNPNITNIDVVLNNETEGTNDINVVRTSCHYFDRPIAWTIYLCLNFIIMFLIPLFIMTVCYGLIVRRLSETKMRTSSQTSVSFTQAAASSSSTKRRKVSSRSDKDRRRVTIMCATLVCCFVICWLPFHTIHLAIIVGIRNTEGKICESLLTAGSLLGYLNSALNPYLYSFLGTNCSRRWNLLKKSRGIGQFISLAAWKQGESSGSNRMPNSRSQKNRSQQERNQISTNAQLAPPTMNTRLSMLKTDNAAPGGQQSDGLFITNGFNTEAGMNHEENYGESELITNDVSTYNYQS